MGLQMSQALEVACLWSLICTAALVPLATALGLTVRGALPQHRRRANCLGPLEPLFQTLRPYRSGGRQSPLPEPPSRQ